MFRISWDLSTKGKSSIMDVTDEGIGIGRCAGVDVSVALAAKVKMLSGFEGIIQRDPL